MIVFQGQWKMEIRCKFLTPNTIKPKKVSFHVISFQQYFTVRLRPEASFEVDIR